MEGPPLRILLLEDSATDAELAERVLRRAELHFVMRRVETQADFLEQLETFHPEVIVADYSLPGFDGLSALRIVLERRPETPFIVFSGSLGDERAVEILKLGAADYVLKDRMQRLPFAIRRAHQDALDLLDRDRMERELYREKEFITSVIETTDSLIAVVDAEGKIVRCNPAFARLTGLADEELAGQPWHLALSTEPPAGIEAALGELAGSGPSQFELTIRTRGGARRTIFWQSSAIHRPDCSPEYLVLAGIDLTEKRRLEQQVEHSQRIDSLGRVAATIAHEFNNVLMVIQSSSTLLARESVSPQMARNAADRIAQAIKRGARITKDVTRFARPAELALKAIAVKPWLQALVDDVRRTVGPKVTLDLALPAEDLTILGDPEQLYQVFSNLLVNAREAIPDQGRIMLSAEETTTGNQRQVSFSVRDTGSGIPADTLERIFDPFFTTKRLGTGLGLAVSQQTILAHGGHIFAESVPSQGTTFHVLLPRASEDLQ